jgi:hypothetical protein
MSALTKQDNVAELAKSPSASIVYVTAEMAERWLGKNTKNRHISLRVASSYAADMLAGNWRITGESVKFARDGSLIDGQHRLVAVIMAAEDDPDISVPMFVVRGLANDAQRVVDSGKKRSAADSLTLDGVPHASLVAAAVKLLCTVDGGLLFKDRKLSNVTSSQIRAWLSDHPAFEDFIATNRSEIVRVFAPPSIVAAAVWMMRERNPEAAAEFLTDLQSLANLDGDHPVMVLHKRLTVIRTNRIRLTERDYLALFFRAWNTVRAGRKLTSFPRPKGAIWSAKNFPWPK